MNGFSNDEKLVLFIRESCPFDAVSRGNLIFVANTFRVWLEEVEFKGRRDELYHMIDDVFMKSITGGRGYEKPPSSEFKLPLIVLFEKFLVETIKSVNNLKIDKDEKEK